MGDGRRCRDAMRAAGSAFTSPGISILLEVMKAGRGLARPRRGLCGMCARSASQGRARLYIGRCQAGALLIGREGRGAGGWSILPRTPRLSPDLHKARRRSSAARTLGAHGQVRLPYPCPPWPQGPAHAHAAAAVLDGGSANLRRGRAGLSWVDWPRSGRGSVSGKHTLVDMGRGSRKPSGGWRGTRAARCGRGPESGSRCRREKPGALRGPGRGWGERRCSGRGDPLPPGARGSPSPLLSRGPAGHPPLSFPEHVRPALRSDPSPRAHALPETRAEARSGHRVGYE